MTATLDQSAQEVHLRWTQGDPVSLSALIVGGAGWAGSYDVESDTAEIAALTATVTVQGADGLLAISSAGACPLASGRSYRWRLQQVGGVTRLHGRVEVV